MKFLFFILLFLGFMGIGMYLNQMIIMYLRYKAYNEFSNSSGILALLSLFVASLCFAIYFVAK